MRQAGVRHARHRHPGVLGEVAQVLAHLRGAGGAVEADRVDAEGLERRQGGSDLAADQHRARGLHGDLGEDRQVGPRRGDRALGADDGGLGLQQVLGGLDEDGVSTALDQAGDLLAVGVAERGERGVTERRQLGAGADRTQHEPGLLRRGPGVGRLAGDGGAGPGELTDAVLDAVLAEIAEVRPEGVGLDAVDADRQVGVVDGADDVGPGHVEDLVAALVALEVVEAGVGRLQHGPHGAVGDDDPLGQGAAQDIGAAAHPGQSRR